MKQRITNISSVAKYESKLLTRSWFFKIYIAIAAAFVAYIGMGLPWSAQYYQYTTSLIPYFAVLGLNVIQSLIIIFMSSDYLKRDKQLDTSEVFYVRPLTNAEYLYGKVLGTMRPFLVLDVVVLIAVFVMCRYGFSIECQPLDFLIYLFIVIVPSLIFFIGVSTAMMLIVGNQAITYIVMLGLSGLSIFYTGGYMEYLFDMFMISTPLTMSDVLGISDLGMVLHGRFIYVMIGLSSMNLSVYLFHRLAGSRRLQNIFLMISIVMFGLSGLLIFDYSLKASRPDRVASRLIELNNKYADYPRLEVADYDIEVEQHPRSISTKMTINGKLSKSGKELVFNLNGGMDVTAVRLSGRAPLAFDREEHLIIVKLGREYKAGDELSIDFEYEGSVDEDEMYIDIANKDLDYIHEVMVQDVLKIDKRTVYLEPKWVVLTPESGWYVRPGVTFADKSANWRQEYFSHFNLRVKPLEGMVPVSQGSPVLMADSLSYSFSPEEPLRDMSLIISKYKKFSTTIGEKEYAAYLHESNLHHIEFLEMVADTIPSMIEDLMGDFERYSEMEYSLPRLTLIDVPEQMYNYKRAWSSTLEMGQPELLLISGGGTSLAQNSGWFGYNIAQTYEMRKKYPASNRGGRSSQQSSDYDLRCEAFRHVVSSWRTATSNTVTYDPIQGYVSSSIYNAHYLPSILFNSRYNIVSDSISWGNQLLEKYYMSFENDLSKDRQSRDWAGMSDLEQVLLLLQEEGGDRYLADYEYSKFISEIIIINGYHLFAEAINNMGVDEFYATLKELIESREYKNIEMGEFLDSVSLRSGVDVRKNLPKTNQPIDLPHYEMGGLKTEMGYLYDEEVYITEVQIRNLTEFKGYVQVQFTSSSDGTLYTVVEMMPHEIKRVVRHTAASPIVAVNTMISGNIPQYVYLGSAAVATSVFSGRGMMGGSGMSMGGGMSGGMGGGMSGGSGMSMGGGMGGGMSMGGGMGGAITIGGMSISDRTGMQQAVTVTPEGDYVIESFEKALESEIIVDNEDRELFSVSDPPTTGYLRTWIEESSETATLYKGSRMRAAYKWELTSGQQFYGSSIFSAHQVRGGDGSQYAEWRIPVVKGERYALSFSTAVPEEVSDQRRSQRRGGGNNNNNNQNNNQNKQDWTYSFTIDNGDGEDLIKYDFSTMRPIRGVSMMWEWIADYTAKQDTIVVRLNNKTGLEKVRADAVKATIINRD